MGFIKNCWDLNLAWVYQLEMNAKCYSFQKQFQYGKPAASLYSSMQVRQMCMHLTALNTYTCRFTALQRIGKLMKIPPDL